MRCFRPRPPARCASGCARSRTRSSRRARRPAQLGVHHEINNALVGVRGNTQLLMLSEAAGTPAVRERLEVVIRESGRIRDAAVQLQELKAALHGSGSIPRAA